MVKKQEIPARGNVVMLNFTPQAGKEMAGPHPALVISQTAYNNATGMIIVCPITSTTNLHKIKIPIDPGFPVSGVILPDQIKCLDWKNRGGKILCKLPDKYVLNVINHLKSIIGF